MNQFLNGLIRATTQSFSTPGPVLELGSFQVDGQEHLGDLRPLFPNQPFFGLDFRTGPGVDILGNARKLPFANGSVKTLVALSILEHVSHFWEAVSEIRRVLHPKGIAIISVPFYFHIHCYPGDYWRFTPDAMDILFESFPVKIVGWQGDDKRPLNSFAVIFGQNSAPLDREQFLCFGRELAKQPIENIGFGRSVLLKCLAPLAGRRMFSPWLDRHRWTIRTLSLSSLPSNWVIRSESPMFIQSNQPE